MLISRANHINSQFELLIVIKVLKSKVEVIKILNGNSVDIRTRRS